MDKLELLWKQYQQHIDLYKFYLATLIKMEVFHYAISGAIFSYYLAHKEIEYMVLALWLPCIISIAFGSFFLYGACINKVSRNDVFKLRNQLGLEIAPELAVLSVLLIIFAIISFIVAFSCVYIILVGI